MRSTVFAFLLLSARGGAAALAAWAVCKLLRRAHAPSRLLCWLWLAVGLRFVLPWGIPLSLPRPQNTQLAAAADTVQELGELPLVAPPPAVSAPAAALPWYARLTPWHALAAVWAVGVAVLAVRGIVGYIKLKRHVALACKTSDGCYGGACVTAPFTLGILRPRVYLPDDLQGTARQAVLLHEQTHIRRRDPLTKPLFYAVVCLHWFNPLAWLAFCTFERDMEAACDEAAVRGRPLPERNAYCESLLHFAVQGRSIPGSLAFGQGSVKERIVHLLHYRRLGAGALAVCAAVVGLSVTACMVRPQVEDAPVTAAPPATAETAEPTPTPAPTSVPAVAAAALPTLDNAANSPRFICPVKYKYISRFATNGHRGDDLCAAEGTEIYAAADGVVLAAQEHYSWGNFVEIDHGTDADGLRWATLYAHMQSCAVQVGQTVTAGQVIGYVGSTGNATGNACHFEMYVNGTLVEPRYFTAYDGSDAAELTQEKADEILAEAVRRAASDQVTAADGAALSGVDLFTLPVAPPPQVSGYDPENGHPGIDFAAEEGAEVYAVAGGIVTAADYDVEKGNYVVLDHGGLETEYQHMKSLLVSAGQAVVQGQVLGYVGSTGNSTGPHLHFEARQDGAPADLTGTALLAE
ncbi:M23/M56 family metallopeptidase [uncultured Gemmiger sp.]|uniref:M23/M56 family metallopeptidase n=1 Tax=uncultured Gemmiger sp. TaxID=1623490 RepID=UPI0027E11471|nr:M23/M56 family metallopeptidase [uncultured Gemmiger sp.]